MKRHFPLSGGAEVTSKGVRFRFWAPGSEAVHLELDGQTLLPMQREAGGWFSITTRDAAAGSTYRYCLDHRAYPDPVSRFQPEGPHAASEVVDPATHDWTDTDWSGVPWEEAVIYELHIGTFSLDGTLDGAVAKLDHLVELGITVIEMMPVSECSGRWNWGYDGVMLFAVEQAYGGPAAMKRFVEQCHLRGIAVVLDVVYNHFGPDGNYIPSYAPQFFTDKHKTPWGDGINFDDTGSSDVRRFFIENALFWLEEYHLDGLRLDAVHSIQDDSKPDIVEEIGRRIRQAFEGRRHVLLIVENDLNTARWLGHGAGGPGPFDAQWTDDFHHSIYTQLTGARGGYYIDYEADPTRHLGRVLAEGFAFQGEVSGYRQGKPRGEASAGLPPTAFISFLQNHDQVGNHAYGWRLPEFAPPDAILAGAALMLLSPHIPLLWQGEEWNSRQVFPFFCDFQGELAEAVRAGRISEFGSFPEFQTDEARARIPDPIAVETFRAAHLDWPSLQEQHARDFHAVYRLMIRQRKRYITPFLKGVGGHSGSYQVEHDHVLRADWRLAGGVRLHLLCNLSPEPTTSSIESFPGETIYATPDRNGSLLPAWHVEVAFGRPPADVR